MKVCKEPKAKLIAPASALGPCLEPKCLGYGGFPILHCVEGGAPFQPG